MQNNIQLKNKLTKLPKAPGVYFHKDKSMEIIYVGKAANLRNRVRQYFHASRLRDPKTDALISEIADVDWIEVDSEADALFLEAEMIRRYLPRYNILLRDDKSNCYIRISSRDHAPSVSISRRPIDDGADYYGPFLQAGGVRKALKYLRKAFPFSTHTSMPERACLQYHLGLCPGPETPNYSREEYSANLKKMVQYIKGNRKGVLGSLEKEMRIAASSQNFEQAARLRNKILSLKALQSQILFSDKENMDLSKDHALSEITYLLGLKKPPRRIEGYDISHMSGTDTVASMVVFTNGVSDKSGYRKFKMRISGNDDFAHMKEVITRRFSNKNIKLWPKPDLVLIDGGKGQLSVAIDARDFRGQNVPMISLAKKYEEIVVHKYKSGVSIDEGELKKLKGYSTDESEDFIRLVLPHDSNIVKLAQRIRDESHRFAVSYHSSLKRARQTKSALDDIPGIGPLTRKKILQNFGSLSVLKSVEEEALVAIIGPSKARLVRQYFSGH